MIKKITTALLLIGVIFGLIWLIPAYQATRQSEALWRGFQAALMRQDMATVRRLLADTDQDLHEIVDNRILYYGHDLTAQLIRTPARFWATMEYYLTDPRRNMHDKIVLQAGYAQIDHGQITFLKIP